MENRPEKRASVQKEECVACGCCTKVCRPGAISVFKGLYAVVDSAKCVGCGMCARECPAGIISIGVEK